MGKKSGSGSGMWDGKNSDPGSGMRNTDLNKIINLIQTNPYCYLSPKNFEIYLMRETSGKSLRESWLPATDGHLCVPGARHGSLVDVGAPHDDVGVIDDDHLAVHVDHLPHTAQPVQTNSFSLDSARINVRIRITDLDFY
jgi:hypothetical protein